MNTNKLFKILVLGGALITAPSLQAEDSSQDKEAQVILQELLDAKPIAPALEFCAEADPNTCVTAEDGSIVPKAGIACCWGTSCES